MAFCLRCSPALLFMRISAIRPGFLILTLNVSCLTGGTLCHRYVYDSHFREPSSHRFRAVASAAVVFCFTGIVRTSVIVTGVQVFSRIFMVWFIANSIRQVTVPLSPFLLLSFQQAVPSCLILMVPSGLNQDPEWRKRNPILGRVDVDGNYQIFLLHIQAAAPPAILHQMGQVKQLELLLCVCMLLLIKTNIVFSLYWRKSVDSTVKITISVKNVRIWVFRICGDAAEWCNAVCDVAARLLAPGAEIGDGHQL